MTADLTALSARIERSLPSSALAVAIAGPAAWSLIGSRWGSYVGVGPVFITDVLVAVALVALGIGLRGQGPLVPVKARGVLWLSLVLLVFCFVRLVGNWHTDLLALRDLAPLAYLVLLPVSMVAVATMPAESRSAIGRLLYVCLGVHAVWFAASQLSLTLRTAPLTSWEVAPGVAVFQVRADVDTALAGVFLALVVHRGYSRGFRWPLAVLAVLAGTGMVLTGSRAGLFGGLTAVAGALLHLSAAGVLPERRRRVLRSSVPAIVAILVVAVGASSIGERITSTFGGQVSSGVVGGQGTAVARLNAWSQLIDWMCSSASRVLFGVGFGPDYMRDSGALQLLVGEGSGGTTRSPHNFWLSVWARVGLVGLVLMTILVGVLVRAALTVLRRIADVDELGTLTSLVVLALMIPASLGVVLESPFGAVPFFWCGGVVAAYASRRRRTRGRPVPFRVVPVK